MRRWWHTRTERERAVLAGGMTIVLGALLYLAIEPLGARRARLETEVPALAADLAWMRAHAAELTGLREHDAGGGAATAPLSPVMVEDALRRAQLQQYASGLRPDARQTTIVIAFDAVPYAPLLDLIHELKVRDGARVGSARIEALPDRPGFVRAELGLTRAGAVTTP